MKFATIEQQVNVEYDVLRQTMNPFRLSLERVERMKQDQIVVELPTTPKPDR